MKQQLPSVFSGVLLLAAVTLAISGTAYGDEKEKNGKAEMAATAKVTIDQAVKTASEKVLGTITEAELEKKHNKLVWEVEVVTMEKKVMEVHIDAITGAVIDVEEEHANPDKSLKRK
ncbi:MAG: PepSY domain-containing protein [Nitrospira sp.]|nr:PepSY domain-containing protein [Nitrospira sp.]MBH0183400.1 PepSY domain-containing protein [Nitrospira sp.]MBH0186857.1 PepSY domain-containing protein [Nitrospira sp.]